MIQIDAGYFCAGIVLSKGIVTVSAPIVKYMLGWSRQMVINYCIKKRWKYNDINW